MDELSNDNLLSALTAEMQQLAQQEVGVRLDVHPEVAFAVVAMLQLALRHPDAGAGPTGVLVRSFIDLVKGKFAPFPAISEALRRGDNSQYDEREQPAFLPM